MSRGLELGDAGQAVARREAHIRDRSRWPIGFDRGSGRCLETKVRTFHDLCSYFMHARFEMQHRASQSCDTARPSIRATKPLAILPGLPLSFSLELLLPYQIQPSS